MNQSLKCWQNKTNDHIRKYGWLNILAPEEGVKVGV